MKLQITQLFFICFGIFAFVMSAKAGTVRIQCSNASGKIKVELTGQKDVVLLGKEIKMEELGYQDTKEGFESVETTLNDPCYHYKIGKSSDPIKTINNPGRSTVKYYTKEFEMIHDCRRRIPEVYNYLMDPKSYSVKALLLCKDYKGF